MQRAPGSRINEISQPLKYGHLSPLIDFLLGKSGFYDLFNRGLNLSFDLLDFFNVFIRAFYLSDIQFPAKFNHFFKIGSHKFTP